MLASNDVSVLLADTEIKMNPPLEGSWIMAIFIVE